MKTPATAAVSRGPINREPTCPSPLVSTASITWVTPSPITKPHWPPNSPTRELTSDIPAIQKNQLAPLRNWASSRRRAEAACAAGSRMCSVCMGGPSTA